MLERDGPKVAAEVEFPERSANRTLNVPSTWLTQLPRMLSKLGVEGCSLIGQTCGG